MIERTSAIDLMQLAADLPGAPMQVAAVLMLDTTSAPELAAVRDAVGERLRAVPRLRQRLVRAPFGGGRPIWVDDPDFAVAHHVTAVGCPAPGDERAVLAVAAGIATRRLARDRPLWSVTLVTSLAGGRSALIVVLHHVVADGIGGLAVLAGLVDGAPVVPDGGFPQPAPGRRALLADAFGSRLRAVADLPAGVRRLCSAAPRRPPGPPRSSLNQPTGARRALAVARADLAAVRRAAHAHGATVNDVVLTAVTGALREVLRHRGETADRYVISVPTSARRGTTAGHLGNRVGVMLVPVTVRGDRGARLAAVARTTRARRPDPSDASGALLRPAFRILAALGVLHWLVDRQRLVTTMVTNLHGPEARLAFLGAPITDVIPVSPATGNVTVAFAVLSYAGTLVITVVADPGRCPDLPLLTTCLRRELAALSDCGAPGAGARPGRPAEGGVRPELTS